MEGIYKKTVYKRQTPKAWWKRELILLIVLVILTNNYLRNHVGGEFE